jgi:alcohol dehydrogenase class IV
LRSFIYDALPARVIFGAGTLARAGEELARLGARRAVVLSTPEQAETAKSLVASLGNNAAGIFAHAAMHTPVEVTAAAMAEVHAVDADCTVAIGGGSTIGLGKAIALRTDLPQIAIPTTYAGSEMTPIIGETEGGRKTTQRTQKVLPETVIYDVELTLSLPAKLSVTSGMNSVAHAVEALYAENRNPIVSLMAEECIAAFARSLPKIVADPTDRQARSDALYGAWLGGTCLGAVGMALHHKLCHVLGGSFDLPHAETHTVVLPHALAYNAAAAPEAAERIARAIGARDAASGLFDLEKSLGAPTSLRELGMPEDGIERAADIAMQSPYWNPRPLERGAIRDLIARAWVGERPS